MPLITHDDILAVSDANAIAELRAAFDRQRRAFRVDPYPTLEERSQRIGALPHDDNGWARPHPRSRYR